MSANGKSKENTKLEAMALAVATGSSVKAAAEQTGCSARQGYRYSSQPEFRARVAELRSEITSNAVGTLTAGASEAAATLVTLLDATSEPPIRLAAAKAILASVAPITELGELRQRLDAIEQTNGG